jgi:hypothetical protein
MQWSRWPERRFVGWRCDQRSCVCAKAGQSLPSPLLTPPVRCTLRKPQPSKPAPSNPPTCSQVADHNKQPWRRTRRQAAQKTRLRMPCAACPTTSDCDATCASLWRRRGTSTPTWCACTKNASEAIVLTSSAGPARREHTAQRDTVPRRNRRGQHHQGFRQLHQGRCDDYNHRRGWKCGAAESARQRDRPHIQSELGFPKGTAVLGQRLTGSPLMVPL